MNSGIIGMTRQVATSYSQQMQSGGKRMEPSITQEYTFFINEVNKYAKGAHLLNLGAELSVIEEFERNNKNQQ
jgi:hypothetical protein